jgi:hypothetical protein
MEDCFLDYSSILEMLDNDSLQHLSCHACIPNPVRIYHNDGTSGTDA